MNIRQKYELKMLSVDGSVNMTKVAEMFSINLRTVRYDIGILNEFLLRELGRECIFVTNKTAQVDGDVKEKLAGLAELGVKDFYTDRLTGEERMLLIVFDLCWSNGYSTIQDIADKYFVSRTTVNADMVAVKEYCRKNGISLISQRGKGLCIEADEVRRRKYLSKVIRDFTALTGDRAECDQSIYSQWFEEDGLDKIKAIVTDVEEAFATYLDDIAYEALAIHIALSIKRFRLDEEYGEPRAADQIEQDSLQYQMAFDIVRRVNECFHIRLPDAEIYYVAVHMGAKSSAITRQETSGDVLLEYYCIKLIAGVSKRIDCDLTNDDRLYEFLIQHISACTYRKKNGMLLENPLKEELIHNYPELYEAVKTTFPTLGEPGIIVPTDDEIAYILLHFAAAINRRNQNAGRLVNIVVVCATGIGTAELVVTGLNRNFKLNIKGTVARHQLEKFLKKEDVDLIITTVPLQTRKTFVKVSPLLKREDVVRVSKQLLDMGFNIERSVTAREGESVTAIRLRELLDRYAAKEDEEILLREIGRIAQHKNFNRVEGKYMLSELINEASIRLDVECATWEEAVRESGRILVENGDITEEYIQAVIDNVNEVGPYIVITKGVALPHATNKIGVKHTAMSFISLKTPVNFGSKANDPVKYVFMLATIDANSHLGALQDLAEFLGRKEFIETLGTARDAGSIVSYIKENETNNQEG